MLSPTDAKIRLTMPKTRSIEALDVCTSTTSRTASLKKTNGQVSSKSRDRHHSQIRRPFSPGSSRQSQLWLRVVNSEGELVLSNPL